MGMDMLSDEARLELIHVSPLGKHRIVDSRPG